MLPIPYRFLLTIILATVGMSPLRAQPYAAVTPQMPDCGTMRMMGGFDRARAIRNTAERTPELYRQAVAEAKADAPRLLSAEVESFWAPDYVTQQFVRVNAVRVHMGRLARIWVDVRDTARADLKAKLQILITALEDSTAPGSRNPGKGIIDNDVEVFGPTPTTVGDGYQDFLLFDISDQSILGFFLPGDQGSEEFSNRRNMLYIDSREGMTRTTSVLNTLAHEFQHLIHHGLNQNSDLFINEGCSEVAGLMCGYPDRANTSYLRNTNTSMLDFPMGDPTGANEAYERALTVVHYLYEQFGDGVLRGLPRANAWGMIAIDRAIATVDSSASWQTVGGPFAIANWLQTNSDPRYSYRVKLTTASQRQARPLRTYTATSYRSIDSVSLKPYGIGYIVYDNPGSLVMKFEGRYRYRTIALCYSGDSVEVIDEGPGATLSLGTGFPYDRVVLVLVELSNATQKIKWAINEAISGVDDESIAATTGFRTISPNPATITSEIVFAASGRAAVRLALYAPTGELVRTIVDGERLAAGEHRRSVALQGLAAGTYVVRLEDGPQADARIIVVR